MFGYIHVPLLCLFLLMLTASYVQGDCPASNLPTVGNSTHDGDGTYAVSEVVHYTCNEGFKYVVRPKDDAISVMCAASGHFIGTVPSCAYIDENADYGVGSGCEASGMCCPAGADGCYTADGCYCDEMCMVFGDCCSDYYTYCQGVVVIPEVYCYNLPHLDKAYNDGTGVYQEGAVITYTCNTGFAFQNPSQNTVTCSSWGTFSGSLSPCLQVTVTPGVCASSALPTVLHSVHDGDGPYQEGDVVMFTCNTGYLLVPGAPCAISCLYDGTFSGTPACVLNLNTACYANGTIVVDNPDTAMYVTAHASDTDSVCTTAWKAKGTVAKGLLAITGCDKNSVITVSFSSRPSDPDDTDEILGGADVYSHMIMCDEIDAGGVSYTFTQGLSPELSTASEAPVAPMIAVLSAFRTLSPVGEVQTTATVGEELYWTIDVPEEYTVLPTSCTAYAGTATSGTPSELLLQYGCTQDVYLLESFSDDKIQGGLSDVRRYYTRMWAFKFQTNNHVFFHCNILLCTAGSPNCNIDCDERKKRSAELGEGEMIGTTSRVLLVNPADEFVNSSAKSRLQQNLAVTCAVTLVCWLIKAIFL